MTATEYIATIKGSETEDRAVLVLRAQIAESARGYDVGKSGIISSPGKFEGEPWYVPYFHSMVLDGFSDDSTDDEEIFDLSDDECRAICQKSAKMRLWFRDDGFVQEV